MEFGENYFPAYSQDKIKKLNNMYEMSDGNFNTFYLVVEKDHIKAYAETNINYYKITARLLRHTTLIIQSATYHTGKIRARRVPYNIRCLILSVEEKN